jgi:hypothetical protein
VSASRKKWQKEFIKKVFTQKTKNNEFYDIILDDVCLLNCKNRYLPNSLYKFYTTTSENILDIKNKRLWLSHPSTFNDPYDCSIGYNEVEYEKKQLFELIKKNNLLGDSGDNVITENEYNEIYNSCVNGEEYYLYSKKQGYSEVIYRILNEKTPALKDIIYKLRKMANDDAKQKVDNIRKTNIRVACFSAEKPHGIYYISPQNNECLSKIQMWSHYTNNHKGFCVEYDISSMKQDISLNFSMSHFFSDSDKDKYLAERLSVITKGGLFPVIYTSQRVNIPYTKLKKYNLNERNDIIEILYNAYITKSTVWSYENEWRLIVDEKVSGYYRNKIPFPYVKKIYLGCKMEKSHVDELISIADEIGAEIQFMEMESHKFDLYGSSPFSYKFDKERRLYNVPYKK